MLRCTWKGELNFREQEQEEVGGMLSINSYAPAAGAL